MTRKVANSCHRPVASGIKSAGGLTFWYRLTVRRLRFSSDADNVRLTDVCIIIIIIIIIIITVVVLEIDRKLVLACVCVCY